MVGVTVTSSERKQFRADMTNFRKISARYTKLLKAKGVKNQYEYQSNLGLAKQQYYRMAEELNTKYNDSLVVKSVDKLDGKIRGWSALALLASLGLGFYLHYKGNLAPHEQINGILEYFQNNPLVRGGSALLVILGALSMILMMPLEHVFSEKPMETFRGIGYLLENKKYEKKPGDS